MKNVKKHSKQFSFNTVFFHIQYFIAVFLIFVTMLVGGILGYVFREKVDRTLRNEMFGSIREYGNNRYVTRAWDDVQSRLRCCGVDGKDDWRGNIPNSCCTPILGRYMSDSSQNGCGHLI